ncbi:mannonate dehydratase [Clostridium sp. E02]|uniref:mannonate dehydratase n=1 Tax=Clostridium sp. E02 TaxID=2487134 RepID=UPI000F542653|nr:mannonate dehydratase [Clostridium sp. E02]
MKMTFRWFGEGDDSVSLENIRQIPGCTGLMGVMTQYAAGEVWPLEEIKKYVKHVQDAGLEVEVIESVNVHEDIKMGLPSRDRYIDNYITTIRNLAQCGVKIIVYNFMPVFDWLRTDLARVIEDGSNVLYYDDAELQGMTPITLVEKTTQNSKGFSLPGWEPERLKELEGVLNQYKNIDADQLRENYRYFLEKIIPVCEEVGIRMAVHPDDPAWPVFGLPRISHSKEDFDKIVGLVNSPANALCLCTGSLGSNPANDIPSIIRHFGSMDRIACVHVRNVKFLGEKKFRESSHLSSDGDLDMFEIMKALHDTGFSGHIRPDHGRMIWGEEARPGYGLYDRALGIMYLNGIWEALEKLKK